MKFSFQKTLRMDALMEPIINIILRIKSKQFNTFYRITSSIWPYSKIKKKRKTFLAQKPKLSLNYMKKYDRPIQCSGMRRYQQSHQKWFPRLVNKLHHVPPPIELLRNLDRISQRSRMIEKKHLRIILHTEFNIHLLDLEFYNSYASYCPINDIIVLQIECCTSP